MSTPTPDAVNADKALAQEPSECELAIRARRFGSCSKCGGANGHDYALGGAFCMNPLCGRTTPSPDKALMPEAAVGEPVGWIYQYRLHFRNNDDDWSGDRVTLGSDLPFDDPDYRSFRPLYTAATNAGQVEAAEIAESFIIADERDERDNARNATAKLIAAAIRGAALKANGDAS